MTKYSVKTRVQLLKKFAQQISPEKIKQLQNLLKKINPQIKVDGALGPITNQAIQSAAILYKLPTNLSQPQLIDQLINKLSNPAAEFVSAISQADSAQPQSQNPWDRPTPQNDIFKL